MTTIDEMNESLEREISRKFAKFSREQLNTYLTQLREQRDQINLLIEVVEKILAERGR